MGDGTSNWLNPVDKLPWLSAAWGTHIAYGGLIGTLCLVFGATPLHAFLVTLALSCAKKAVDYYKQAETLKTCIAKGIGSAVWPATFLLPGVLPAPWW